MSDSEKKTVRVPDPGVMDDPQTEPEEVEEKYDGGPIPKVSDKKK